MPKNAAGTVERLACWAMLQADPELATLVGLGDATQGAHVLAAMKAARALDVAGDGMIGEAGMHCLLENNDRYLLYTALKQKSEQHLRYKPTRRVLGET